MWYLPSLKSIAVLPASDLMPDCRMIFRAGISVAVVAIPRDVSFFGKASLKSETDNSDPFAANTELSFNTSAAVEVTEPLAYIAEDHRGRRWLIGAFEPPFPKIRQSASTGASPSESHATSVTVTWSHEPMPCTVILPSD